MHVAAKARGVVALALAAAACGGAAAKPAKSPVSAVEVTESGEKVPVPPDGTTDIDINSRIELAVDSNAARQALGSSVAVNVASLEELKSKTTILSAAIASQKAVITELTADLETPPAPEKVPAALTRLNNLQTKALDALQAVSTRAEINADLARGRRSYETSISRLAQRTAELQDQLETLEKSLARVGWRMQATLYSSTGSTDLHLAGYDDIAEGDPNLINKLALPKDFDKTVTAAKTAAADMKDLHTTFARAQAALTNQLAELKRRLGVVADELPKLPDLLKKVESAPWASLKEGKVVVASAREAVAGGQEIFSACRAGFATLRELDTVSVSALIGVLSKPGSSVAACADAIVSKGPAVVKSAMALHDNIATMNSAATSDAALAKALAAQTAADAEALETSLRRSALAELGEAWSKVKDFLGEGAALVGTPTFAAAEHATDRSYREVSDTTIDLVRSARVPGDVVYYRASVVTDGKVRQSWTSAPLRVVVTGVHIDVSGSVVFVRALKPQSVDSSWPAAPAVTATLHYGAKRSANENQGNPVWRFLDPGLGLHVAYLDLGPKVPKGSTTPPSDPATEVGIGSTFQLFGDVVQGGVAYDLQVRRPYWFFGIGLKTATKLGLTVPAGNSP